MTTAKKTAQKKIAESFDLPEWLTDSDAFSHLDVDVYMSPRYKEWVSAKREFDALSEAILSRDADKDSSTLGDEDPQQERLEELHQLLGELTSQVQESRKKLRFVDAATKRDLTRIDEENTSGGKVDNEGAFFDMLAKFGLFDGKAQTVSEWENTARRVGMWQWTLIQAECLEYLGRSGEVTPDFSLPSLPTSPA